MPMPPQRVEHLIVGGGVAGSALAILLAEAGREVMLFERTAGPRDLVCGEFLSPEAIMYLRGLGVDPLRHGAQTITHVRLAAREVIAETKLPAAALSLTRRALDERLLMRAVEAGAKVRRGVAAEGLSQSEGGWCAKLACGEAEGHAMEAANVYLATGKHDLRGHARLPSDVQRQSGVQTDLVAFKMYFRLAPQQQAALSGHVELILYPGGYAGLQLVENGVANLCLLVTRERLRALGSGWSALLEHMQQHSPHLAARLAGAEPMLAKPLALSGIPYGYRAAPRTTEAGLWRLGDQAAVIPSFSGDGMSIALHSAHLAAQMVLDGATPAAYQARLMAELARPVRLATMLSRAMIAMPALAHAVRLCPGVLHPIFNATRVPRRAIEHANRNPYRQIVSAR